MNIYAIIPLISAAAYMILSAIIITRPRTRIRTVFFAYLMVSMLWSFSSFVLHADLMPPYTLMWNRILVIMVFLAPIAIIISSALFSTNPAAP